MCKVFCTTSLLIWSKYWRSFKEDGTRRKSWSVTKIRVYSVHMIWYHQWHFWYCSVWVLSLLVVLIHLERALISVAGRECSTVPSLSYTQQFIFCALYYVVRECRFSVVLLLADGDGPGRPSIAVCKCSQLLAVIDWRQQPRIVLQRVSVISPLLCSLLTSSTVIRVAEGEYSFRSRSPSFAECHVVSLHCRTWVLSRSLTFNTLTTTAYTPYIAVGEESFFINYVSR